MAKDEFWDKLGVALELMFGLSNRNRGGYPFPPPSGGNAQTVAAAGFFASLLQFGIRAWKESGGSLEDEKELLESLFADPTDKATKLETGERKKIIEVMNEMTPRQRLTFRLVLFLMEPEVTKSTIPGKTEKAKDGTEKRSPDKVEEKKSGYDPRISTLKGIASLVDEDYSNAAEIAKMLDDVGILGSDNKALRMYAKAKEKLAQKICEEFEVDNLSKITADMVYSKIETTFDLGEPEPVSMGPIRRFVNACIVGPKNTPKPIFPRSKKLADIFRELADRIDRKEQ